MATKGMGLGRIKDGILAAAILWGGAGETMTLEAESPKPGCEYRMLAPGYYGGKPFQEAPVVRSAGGELNTVLEVKFATNEIAGCETRLRSYDGALVGRTLRVRPGDTININLRNLLPHDLTPPPKDMNTPHGFNITNFHSHGLHVSPAGNSDNVLISVKPQTDWQVEIKVPRDHPTGTFWYHAHLHGSTALQVSSGMAGALIVENPEDPNSLDSIPEIRKAKEQTLLIQQIAYDEQGVIENYNNFGPGAWGQSMRLPTINGQIMPEIVMQPGEVRRWRLIHGGIRETVSAAVVDTNIPLGQEGSTWPLYEIAIDGLSLGYMNKWTAIELQPGYRTDILVKAPPLPSGKSEMVYYLLDLSTDANKSLHAIAEARQVLAKVVVRGAAEDMELPCAKPNVACPTLAPTRPHKNITDQELDGAEETVVFNIASRVCPEPGKPCLPCPDKNAADCKTRFMINEIPFSNNNVRELTLGTASKWELNSDLVNHPFHIHVNPFQHTRKNPLGEDEIVWRDTLLVQQDTPIEIRSRYERYIGQFVLHCHILDHEDNGMMQLVEVVPPGGDAHH